MPLSVSSLIAFLFFARWAKPHAAQHVRRLRELDVVVADDLDAVAPGVAEVEEAARQRLDARLDQRVAHGLLVVDDEAEMTAVVGGLLAALLQRDELVAQIDEGRGLALAAQREIEQAAVERQGLFDVADLQSDVIETDGTRLPCSSWDTPAIPCAVARIDGDGVGRSKWLAGARAGSEERTPHGDEGRLRRMHSQRRLHQRIRIGRAAPEPWA